MQTRNRFWVLVLVSILSVVYSVEARSDDRPPNVIVIFVDDLGYRDIGPFDPDDLNGYVTKNLNQMATEGRRFTDFVSATAVCSASRAALLTGCYHERVSIRGALGPRAKHGLHANEMTLAELCKQKDYATACFGKWHLGHQKPFLPLQHGFDEYYGLPYSNDMWPFHPDYADLPYDVAKRKQGFPDLPLFEGNEIVNTQVTGQDQAMLTKQYTELAVDFIDRNHQKPFLLYVPHTMVHVPLFASPDFVGKSGVGLFGDVMMEIDWSVGEILNAVRQHDLQENTLVIFTSDNGPWLSYGNRAGSALPLREGKGTMFEGGYRVPTVMWWPDTIPADTTCDELASTIDILPTVAALIQGELPEHKIDGKDIRPLMTGQPEAKSPHESFYCYYAGGQLQAVRDRRFKLHLPHSYRTMQGQPMGGEGKPGPYRQEKIGLELFDLRADVAETKNVAEQFPDVVQRLQLVAESARQDLGDRLTDRTGDGVRPHGKIQDDN